MAWYCTLLSVLIMNFLEFHSCLSGVLKTLYYYLKQFVSILRVLRLLPYNHIARIYLAYVDINSVSLE
jgi:hypothetical protein